jgi:hypothetical protein
MRGNASLFNCQQAWRWLVRSGERANQDHYYFRIVITELHKGDYVCLVAHDSAAATDHWSEAAKLATQLGFPHIKRQADERLNGHCDPTRLYANIHVQ